MTIKEELHLTRLEALNKSHNKELANLTEICLDRTGLTIGELIDITKDLNKELKQLKETLNTKK